MQSPDGAGPSQGCANAVLTGCLRPTAATVVATVAWVVTGLVVGHCAGPATSTWGASGGYINDGHEPVDAVTRSIAYRSAGLAAGLVLAVLARWRLRWSVLLLVALALADMSMSVLIVYGYDLNSGDHYDVAPTEYLGAIIGFALGLPVVVVGALVRQLWRRRATPAND